MIPRVVVFISGRGSNLKSLIDGANDYQIVGIVSNKSDAHGLQYGTQFKIPTFSVSRDQCASVAQQKTLLYDAATEFRPDLIALAGYLQIITPEFVAQYRNRILNIHPSLLPKYPKIYGLAPHQAALDAGETVHGCSVHLVDQGIDTGSVIAQAECQVENTDTVETLSQRVLALEHLIYPWVVSQIARGEIDLDSQPISFSPAAHSSAGRFGFKL